MAHAMHATAHSSLQTQTQILSPSASTFPILAVQQRSVEFQHGFREGFSYAQYLNLRTDSENFNNDNSEEDDSDSRSKKESHTTELLKQARAEIDRLQNQLLALEEAHDELVQQTASRAQAEVPMYELDSRAILFNADEERDPSADTTNNSDSDSNESFHYIGKDTADFGEGMERSDSADQKQEREAPLGLKLLPGSTVAKASRRVSPTTSDPCLGLEQEGGSLITSLECRDKEFTQGDEGTFQLPSDCPLPSLTQFELRSYSVEKIREMMNHAHRVGGEEMTLVKSLVSKAHATPSVLRTEAHAVLLSEWKHPQVQTSTPLTVAPTSDSSSQNYVYVDASDIGIGFIFGGKWEAWRLRNGWRQGGRKQGKLRDIQWAETAAVELGVRVMIKAGYAGKAITVCSDNTQVVQAFSQGKPIGEPLAQEVLSNTERLCRQLKIRLKVMWVPGARNPADGPSRLRVGNAEARFPCHAEIPPYLQDVVLPFYQ